MKTVQEACRNTILKSITEQYDNVHDFAIEHHGACSQFHVVDFWEKYNGLFKKESEGNFYEFAIALFDCASANAPDTIKVHFENKDFKLDYDLETPSHILYALAKGHFNGKDYFVKATSENKYLKEDYIFEKELHRNV